MWRCFLYLSCKVLDSLLLYSFHKNILQNQLFLQPPYVPSHILLWSYITAFSKLPCPTMIRKEPGATKTRSDPVVSTSLTRQCVQCLVQAFSLPFSYPVVCMVIWKQSKLMDLCVVAHSTNKDLYFRVIWEWKTMLKFLSLRVLLTICFFTQTAVCTTVTEAVQNKRKREMKFFLPNMWCSPSCRGKAVPLQAWTGPEGSRKLRLPDFVTTAQDGGEVVSFMHWPPLPPGNTPGTHFC